mgnify:CR=1 FL=1
MDGELNFRFLKEKDYDTICKWWKWWRWPIVPREMLPGDGKSGFMVEKNNISIVSAYLYLTNSTTAILEWVVSNPNYKETDRKKAIELLISKAEDVCKNMGYNNMYSISRNKHLIEIHEKLGWHVDKKPSYEIIKTI